MALHILFFLLFITRTSVAFKTEPYKDFCVADLSLSVGHEGFYPCKDPKRVQVNDFSYGGLQFPADTSTPNKGGFAPVFDRQLPGLNGLGISFFRFDFAVGGFIPPHYHPRGSELWTVVEGTVQVWFDSSVRQFTKVVRTGDVFVVPIGLVHWLKNVGKTNVTIFGSFSHQDPGVILMKY